MIVEQLFTGYAEVELPTCPSSTRDFSEIEENAIYNAAGYTIRKLLKKFNRMDSLKSMDFLDVLNNMLGEDQARIRAHSTYVDYVKAWMRTNDHGGLMHMSLDTFHCFKAIEAVIDKFLKSGSTKEEVTTQAFISVNVKFHRMLICNLPNEAECLELLQNVIEIWFTVRGFSLAGKLFEDYEKATKSNVRGKKGFWKELH